MPCRRGQPRPRDRYRKLIRVQPRFSHAYGVSQAKEDFRFRVAGMPLTFSVLILISIDLLGSLAYQQDVRRLLRLTLLDPRIAARLAAGASTGTGLEDLVGRPVPMVWCEHMKLLQG